MTPQYLSCLNGNTSIAKGRVPRQTGVVLGSAGSPGSQGWQKLQQAMLHARAVPRLAHPAFISHPETQFSPVSPWAEEAAKYSSPVAPGRTGEMQAEPGATTQEVIPGFSSPWDDLQWW